MRLFLKSNTRGYTFTEVLVAASIIAIVGVGGSQLYFSNIKSARGIAQLQAILNQRNVILGSVNSAEGWEKTIQRNPATMVCLANKTDCAGAGAAIDVYDQNDQALSLTAANSGFNDKNEICNTYDTATNNCLHRYVVSWQPVCPTGVTCLNPQIKITGILQTKDQGPYIQSMKLNFEIFRAPVEGSLKKSCESIGGNYDANTRNCTLSAYGNICAVGTVVKGINTATKTMVCGPVFATDIVCPPGTVLFGFASDGSMTPRCEPKICGPLRECQLNPALCYEERHLINPPPVSGDGSCGGGGGGADGGCGDGAY